MEHGVVVAAHSSSRHFGSCVLLPHPVAPRSSATLESQMAPRMASRCSNAGRLLEVEAAAALSCGTARAGEGSAAVVALGAMDAVAAGAVAMSARAARSGAVRVNMSPDNPVGGAELVQLGPVVNVMKVWEHDAQRGYPVRLPPGPLNVLETLFWGIL